MRSGGVYDRSIRVFSAVYAVIGVVILVMTLARGGGPTSVGFLIGLAFVGVGIGRYLVQRRIAQSREQDPE
ncbi:MAG: hypothetical protein J0H98_05195 [Solirubrobacterales bacterium]|nr:hypothetical protein [Solirubrobacterales bacterium]